MIENLNLTLTSEVANSTYNGSNLVMHIARVDCGSNSDQWPSGFHLNGDNDLQYLTGNQNENYDQQTFIYFPPDSICSQKEGNSSRLKRAAGEKNGARII